MSCPSWRFRKAWSLWLALSFVLVSAPAVALGKTSTAIVGVHTTYRAATKSTVSGKLTRVSKGTVAGARLTVYVWRGNRWSRKLTAKTNARGRFSVALPTFNTYLVSFAGSGSLRPSSARLRVLPDDSYAYDVSIDQSAYSLDGSSTTVAVRGHASVWDANLKNVRVRIQQSSDDGATFSDLASVLTNGNGDFNVSLPEGDYRVFAPVINNYVRGAAHYDLAPNFDTGASDGQFCVYGQDPQQVFIYGLEYSPYVQTPTGTVGIHGTLNFGGGRNLVGVPMRVWKMTPSGDWSLVASGTTDADSRFAFENLGVGHYQLTSDGFSHFVYRQGLLDAGLGYAWSDSLPFSVLR